MTEDEARKKWCPMSRTQFPPHASTGNRNFDGTLTKTDNCVGSACMMWRLVPRIYTQDPQHGYCGLAGKPMVKT